MNPTLLNLNTFQTVAGATVADRVEYPRQFLSLVRCVEGILNSVISPDCFPALRPGHWASAPGRVESMGSSGLPRQACVSVFCHAASAQANPVHIKKMKHTIQMVFIADYTWVHSDSLSCAASDDSC